MVCIHCGGYTRVTNSRLQKKSNNIWRRRVCIACKAVFTTHENIDLGGVWLIASDNGKQVHKFSRDKLYLSIFRSLSHRASAIDDADALAQTVINKLQASLATTTIDTGIIAGLTEVALSRFDNVAALHYAAHHKA